MTPWIDQAVGTFPTPADCVTCAPFMNQIATLPLLSCQRMSLLPSALKSWELTVVSARRPILFAKGLSVNHGAPSDPVVAPSRKKRSREGAEHRSSGTQKQLQDEIGLCN
ncbi:MAG TPA: hypothetical protein VKT99_17690 [Xanthobacteraceae bacterium]|nr:hypothetical protein [Xanthobacteraceae bacterium]